MAWSGAATVENEAMNFPNKNHISENCRNWPFHDDLHICDIYLELPSTDQIHQRLLRKLAFLEIDQQLVIF
jgi:hypothetical protein